jgi:hypothetical protein
MLGLPSPSALRTAAVAVVAGAGVSLVGLSFANVAAMDGSLAAATQHPASVQQDSDVSFRAVRDCPRGHAHRLQQLRQQHAPTSGDWQY